MKKSRHSMPQVNAGSMADIAFLLLIFFLVTAVIPNDEGITRKLPPPCPSGEKCNSELLKHNVLEVKVNGTNELYVDNNIIPLDELQSVVISFLDNNGDLSCSYCRGDKNSKSSDNPNEAVISLKHSKGTSYQFYIDVQDELTKAYLELRTRYAKTHMNKAMFELTKAELMQVKKAYPFKLSEAEIN